MKNIHILSTSQPSRLYFYKGDNKYPSQYGLRSLKSLPFNDSIANQNIYITSDEEIKEGDWFITTDTNKIHKSDWVKFTFDNGKKIILTTDQDLIGVQTIDDNFLEWFVKNPSCEEVDVEKEQFYSKNNFINGKTAIIDFYKIIIQKEEETKCYCGHTITCDCVPEELEILETPMPIYKQETLEEASEKISPIQQVINFITENFQKECEPRQLSMDLLKKWCEVKLLNEESKWQQERSYSEEEVLEILREYALEEHLITSSKPDKWFKQYERKNSK